MDDITLVIPAKNEGNLPDVLDELLKYNIKNCCNSFRR